ncbi:MAG: hypothetical protein ACREEE_13180 [Dongiaceae bacterium]
MTLPVAHQSEVARTDRYPRLKVATRLAGLTPVADAARTAIIFTHVPKTGGTTLDYIFVAAAAATKRKSCHLSMKSLADRPRHERSQQILDFGTVPQSDLGADYLTGHFQFGLHRLLDRPSFYVTLMRNPAARLLSNLRFGIDRGMLPGDTTVERVFQAKRLLDNIQTRQLAGIADRDAPCTPETLARARENLHRHYAVAGVTERFDETLRALITLLGWPDIAYTDRQVSRTAIDPERQAEAAAAVERYFAFDLELYAEVAARPVPWSPEVMTGNVTGSARQDAILVTSPVIKRDDRPYALISAAEFDTQLCPALKKAGGEVVYV